MARKIRKTLKSGGRKLNKKKVNKITQKKQKGGIKKALGKKEGIREGHGDYSIKVVWKGKDRVIYTYDPRRFSDDYKSQSQGTESSTDTTSGRKIITLMEFGENDSIEKLTREISDDIRYIFVIVFECNKGDTKGHAKMYLGDQSYNHDELSHDVGAKNWILAAGEIRKYLDEDGKNKLIINNQSGHYRPDEDHVEIVTRAFFEGKIDIKFEPYNETQSQSSQGSYGSYGGKRSRKNKKSRKVKIIRR